MNCVQSKLIKAIRTLVSQGDLLAVLPNGFGKSLIFQVLVCMKEILTGKTSVIVVCPLKSIVQDQIAEASSMGLTAVSLADNCLEDIENAKRGGDSVQVMSFVSDVNKTDRPNTTPMVRAICTFAVLLFGLLAFLSLHSCL